MKHPILITSVGSLVGHNLLDALEGRRQNLVLIGTNSVAEAVGNFRCDRVFLVPPAADRQAFMARLREIMLAEQVVLALPGRDDDILVLAELAQAHSELAGRVAGARVSLAAMMDDKLASHDFALAHGLPFVPTVASDGDPAQLAALRQAHGFPLIAKPRSGNGSRGILVLLDDAHLARMAGRPGYAVQPMVDAPPGLSLDLSEGLPFFWGVTENRLYAVQSLIDRDGRVRRGPGLVYAQLAGHSVRAAPWDDPGLLEAAGRYAATLAAQGWRGPLSVQFKRDARQGYLAIELNGRFTGGTATRTLLGFDEVADGLNDWLGPDTVPPRPAGPAPRLVQKSPCAFPVPEAACDTLERTGTWARSS